MKTFSLATLLLLTIACTGCIDTTKLAGKWGQLSPDRNRVQCVKKGMRVNEVMNKVGEPVSTEEGSGVYIGWTKWSYPTGDVLFYRGAVKLVSVKPLTEEVKKELDKANSKGFEFGYEDEKESTLEEEKKRDDELSDKDNMWAIKDKQNDIPKSRNYKNPHMLEGFAAAE